MRSGGTTLNRDEGQYYLSQCDNCCSKMEESPKRKSSGNSNPTARKSVYVEVSLVSSKCWEKKKRKEKKKEKKERKKERKRCF